MKSLVIGILIIHFLLVALLLNAQSCLPEGIFFTNQAQIDSFQINYPGCNEIEGNVTIEGDDIINFEGLDVLLTVVGDVLIGDYRTYPPVLNNQSLTSLSGMENLNTIGGSLLILNNNALTSLNGLDNLDSIGVNVHINHNDSLITLNGLESLSSIGGDLNIGGVDFYPTNGNPSLTTLNGLENLDSIGGDLLIRNNQSLTNCEAASILNYLNDPAGEVTIYGNSEGCASIIEIAMDHSTTLPCLEYGDYILISQYDIDHFPVVFPDCSTLNGDVEIFGAVITDLDSLDVINSIGDALIIRNNDDLTSLSGLENLTYLGGPLLIRYNDDLTSLSGLENLTYLGGSLIIEFNYDLISVSGLDNLTSIGGSLIIRNTDDLTSLTGLENLTSIGGALYLDSNIALSSLTGLDNLTSIGGAHLVYNHVLTSVSSLGNITSIDGSLYIGWNPLLTSLSGLDNLDSIEGNLIIEHIDALTSLYGLTNLTFIGGKLSIYTNKALTSLTGLNNVTSIGGALVIYDSDNITSLTGLDNVNSVGGELHIAYNDTLTSLTGLDNLTSIGGYLLIGENYALTSLEGLGNIDTASIDDLYIINNIFLHTCEIQSVCNYLSSPNGEIEIYDNAPGCNSPEEVEDACETVDVSEIEAQTSSIQVKCSPNPFTTSTTIEFHSPKPQHVEISIYNQLGELVDVFRFNAVPGKQTYSWDAQGLPSGVYIVQIHTDNKVSTKKIIKLN